MKKLILITILLIGFIGNSQNKKYTTYRVSQHETISSIAIKLGITPYDLLKLNPDANNGISIDEVLIIPNKKFNNKSISNSQASNVIVKQKDSIVDGYLYHTVKPLETIYSLSRKYDISKRKVKKINKLNRKGDISVGQVLKFPTDLKDTVKDIVVKQESIPQVSNNDFVVYTVKSQDTYYSLTRLYNVTEGELRVINYNLSEGLKAGLIIKIPKANNIENQDELVEVIDSINIVTKSQYITHHVKAKEGFFRLKQLYGISKEELIKVNPELKEGLKLGMDIKIPVKLDEELFKATDVHGKILNVVMLLPFKANEEISMSDDNKKSRLLKNVTDFYLGSLMALDSIKKKGLSVNVKVFDTKNSDFVINNILSTYNFENTNLVIAPIKYNQFIRVSKKMEQFNIPVISPSSKKDCNKIGVSNSVQNVAPKTIIYDRMIEYMLANITNQNIVIIADEKNPSTLKEGFNIDLIKSKLAKHDSIKNVSIVRMKDGYIERKLFEEAIKEKKENWVILASKKKSTTYISLENLSVFPKEFNITLFSLSKPKSISSSDDAYKIKSSDLNKLHFQYPEVNFIDEENSNIVSFNKNYNNKYGSLPSVMSYRGFDTLYDALIRLASFDNFNKAFNAGKSYRLISQFNYKQNLNKSFTNLGVYIVRYNDFKLEKVY